LRVAFYHPKRKPTFETIFKKLTPGCEPWVLGHTIQLAVELAREGREGHKIGTMFVVGDEEAALKQSKPLILDPLQGHPLEVKKIDDSNMRETAIFKRTFRRRDGLGDKYSE
jgi:DNA integrity scanning protein DisA with diadenylate cyclase activity